MPLRHISDTARWIAVMRARESARPDALFKDPLAAKVAGAGGRSIEEMMRHRGRMPDWPIVMRTIVLDEHILRGVADGVDMVIDLAAGLDTRPYRLPLPPDLAWVDVDLPGITAEKNVLLMDERPTCKVERIAVDLADATARRALFAQLGARCRKALIIAEGLLVYLTEEQVTGLAVDLHAVPTFHYWTLELVSASLLKRLNKTVGKRLAAAGMPMQWGTAEGPHFFERLGWKLVEARSMFREAAKYRRLPFPMSLFAYLPEGKPPWKDPWAGVCLYERARWARQAASLPFQHPAPSTEVTETMIVLLRLIHILSGVLWVGAAIFINFLLFPALKGDPATMGKVAASLTARGMHKLMGMTAVLTLLSGFWLISIMSGGDMAAYSRGPGRVFTMAGGLATLAFILGLVLARPAGLKVGEIGAALAAATDPAEKTRLQGEMVALQKKTAFITMSVVTLLILATAGMAVARYV